MPTRLASFALAALALTTCDPPAPTASPEPPRTASAAAPAGSSAAPPAPTTAPVTTARATASAAEAARLLADAERCFADPACTNAQAEDLYRRADDAGAGVSCFEFYYGGRVTRDLPRARACFTRKVAAARDCGGSSPDLDRLMLASMLIDAQGGPADPARAASLLAGCYADVSVQALGDEARQRKDLAPDRKPLDFCEAIGGTTLTIGQCELVKAERTKGREQRVARELHARLDAAGEKLAKKAGDAYAKFADLEGGAFADRYRDGSLHSNAWRGHQTEIESARLDALDHLFDYALGAGGAPAAAEKDLDKAYREVTAEGDATRKIAFSKARAAWLAYRDAEIALYVHVFGDKLGKREVTEDVKALLCKRYQAWLEQANRP